MSNISNNKQNYYNNINSIINDNLYNYKKSRSTKKKKKRTLSRDQEIQILKNEINKLTKRMEMRKFIKKTNKKKTNNPENQKSFNNLNQNNVLKYGNVKDNFERKEKESNFLKIKKSVKEQKAETQKILERYESKKSEFEKYLKNNKNDAHK